ncbi:Endo-1,4-beta-xylanase A precursor [compost metagenome]
MRSKRKRFSGGLIYVYILCIFFSSFSTISQGTSKVSAATGEGNQASVTGSVYDPSVSVSESVYEPSVTDAVYVETASGVRRLINVVDALGEGDYIAVLTSRFGDKTNNTNKYNVAVQVDENFKVIKVANKAPVNGNPTWQDSPDLSIPVNGFVLLASDDDYKKKGYKKFAAENFNVGDTVKLIVGAEAVPIDVFKNKTEARAEPSVLLMDQDEMFTVSKEVERTVLSGKLTNYRNDNHYQIHINGKAVVIQADGSFREEISLQPMTNYIDLHIYRGELLRKKTMVTIYRYMKVHGEQEVYMWIEQSTNLNKYPSSEAIRKLLVKAKAAGVTGVQFPVKGSEGFGSHLKNNLSGIPHISQITEASKAGVPRDLDVLQEFITHGHALGLRVDAIFNLYGAGSDKDSGLTKAQFEAFEEWVYRPEDKGAIVRITKSSYKPLVYFMNPANDDNQQYQMNVIEEVMRNYDIDSVVLDRARYDNIYADFSDLSKRKFEKYLEQKGKSLLKWPQDVFEHQYDSSGNFVATVNGPLFYDWLTYRSAGEKEMFVKFRKMVNEVNQDAGKKIPFAISMGSWYTSYYEIGQNWANPNFRYDPRLGFNLGELYTDEYAQTAFGTKEIFDFMVLGTYYNTPAAVKRGISLIHILTQEEFPIYVGFQLEQLPQPEDQRVSFQAALNYTNGIKLFDLSQINWDVQQAALENRTYVKPFQLGISIPSNLSPTEALKPYIAKGFIEADYHNQNRALGTMGVYTDSFGQTTATTGSFGVEVIVSPDGKVSNVVNKKQAMDWKWTGNLPNNSVIPKGGFVISTLDKDGVRTLRQLLASAYSPNDDIRAAMLRGHLAYENLVTKNRELPIRGSVEVLGTGTAKLLLNGEEVALTADGNFTKTVQLAVNKNSFKLEVYVDDKKTNEFSFEVTYTPEESSPNTDPSDTPSSISAPSPSTSGITALGTVTKETTSDGKTVGRVTVDPDKLVQAAEQLKGVAPSEQIIWITVPGTEDIVEAVIPATAASEWIKRTPDGLLVIETELASYQLPAKLLDPEALAASLGTTVSNMTIRIIIEKITGSELKEIKDQALAVGLTPLSEVFDFIVTVDDGKEKREIHTFAETYVTRTIKIPKPLDPAKVTAVRYDSVSGKMTFVPAHLYTRDGVTEVTMKRKGNSIYMLVASNKTFADINGHWAKADIELLASKLIVQGTSDSVFDPESVLTRAELTSLLVRSLGLSEDKSGAAAFNDVTANDWYAGSVGTAAKAGLLQGFEDGTFKPEAAITREQLAVLLARSLKLTGESSEARDSKEEELLAFDDRGHIADWAQNAVAQMVREGITNGVSEHKFAPTDKVTRAQAVVMLRRMLQIVDFIN